MKNKSSVLLGTLFLISGAAALAAYGLQATNDPATSTKSTATNKASADLTFVSESSIKELAGKTLTLSVPDMHCEFACAPAVRKTLAAVPGVSDVTTDVNKRTATLKIGSGFDLTTALAKLEEAGYPAEAK